MSARRQPTACLPSWNGFGNVPFWRRRCSEDRDTLSRASTSLVRRVSGSVRVVGILVSDGLVPPGVLIFPRRAGVCQAFQILAVCYHGCAWYRGGNLRYAMWAAQAAMTGRRASSRSARW